MKRIGITLILLYMISWIQAGSMTSNATGEFTGATSRSATSSTVSTDNRTIVSVEKIEVKCPVGTAPRLPYRVFVHYSDGASEYRQTRWTNSARVTEQAQADPVIHPVGREYTIKGFIIGDNTTPNGYPITAHVQVISDSYLTPDKTPLAEPLPLNKVVINGDNRLSSNRNLAIREIAGWDITRQLYNYRDTYGLSTEGYKKADGWDSPTTKLKGHGSGHYMSALAMAFASANDDSLKIILRKNISRMVNELRACQERTFVWNKELGRYWEARDFAQEEELRNMQGTWSDFDVHKTQWEKYGYGYLNAIPAHHPVLIEMYRGYNNEKWVWAPYYSIHKQLAGLIDIATYVDDQEIADKALLIAKDMGLWIWNRMFYRTYLKTDGNKEERRNKPGNRYEMWNMYIAGEDGGTGESLARLSEMVSDPVEKERLLQASTFFDSPAFFDPLSKNIDDIRTRHANQHIPKITSALRSFKGNNNPYYYNLSENFWNMIQGRYRYSSGGVGNGEMFRQPYTQVLSMATNVTSDRQGNLHPAPTINETCCAYNLAKLTKDLNCYNPDDAKYMDYYERVLYNQLIGSLDHCHYQTTYQYAVGLNASKPWGNRTPQSTCCGGTGSENHVKYQEAAYFVSENTLWVGLYMPTTLIWDAKNVKMQQDCLWPAEHSTIRLIRGTGEFSIKLRVPYWATEGFDVKLNGVSIASDYKPSSYVTIPLRRWTSSDVIEVAMPFGKHIDFGPDKMETAVTGMNETKTTFDPMWAGTLMYGPLAMTATGVTDWEQASLDIDSNLGNIVLNGSSPKQTGAEGNLYTLKLNGITFQPDYYRHNHSTHYFRINLMGDPATELKEPLIAKLSEAKIFQPENYTKKTFTTLKKAIDSGEKLHLAPKVTENEISKQITVIDKAIKGLKANGLDKSLLETAIAEARSKLSDNYTWDSFDNLQRTLAETNKVYETSSSQIQVDRQRFTLEKTIDELVDVRNVDKMTLGEHLFVAKERQREQDSWNALAVKVPEYSPWAPYGFARLLEQIDNSQKVYDNKDKNYSQEEVNIAAGNLNAAINTMRPGNLPELEDMHELSSLLSKGNSIDHSKYTSEERAALKEAIEYAEMVVKYVSDGSGTHDMIESAISRLTSVIK